MNRKEDYIAVFDSGVGGISVLRQLVKQMPGERFLYFGDSANAPYGTKTTEQVRQLSLAVADRLCQRGIKALVVACNTATAAAVVMDSAFSAASVGRSTTLIYSPVPSGEKKARCNLPRPALCLSAITTVPSAAPSLASSRAVVLVEGN